MASAGEIWVALEPIRTTTEVPNTRLGVLATGEPAASIVPAPPSLLAGSTIPEPPGQHPGEARQHLQIEDPAPEQLSREAEPVGIHQESVAAGVEAAHIACVVGFALQAEGKALEALGDGGLAAADAGAGAVDHRRLALAKRDAAAGELPALVALDEGDCVAADGCELVARFGEGVGRHQLGVAVLPGHPGSGGVVALVGHPTIDPDMALQGELVDLEVAGVGLGRSVGVAAVDQEAAVEGALGRVAEGVRDVNVAAFAFAARLRHLRRCLRGGRGDKN